MYMLYVRQFHADNHHKIGLYQICWTMTYSADAEGIIGKSCTDGQSWRTNSTWSSTTNISGMVGKWNWYSIQRPLHIISRLKHRSLTSWLLPT